MENPRKRHSPDPEPPSVFLGAVDASNACSASDMYPPYADGSCDSPPRNKSPRSNGFEPLPLSPETDSIWDIFAPVSQADGIHLLPDEKHMLADDFIHNNFSDFSDLLQEPAALQQTMTLYTEPRPDSSDLLPFAPASVFSETGDTLLYLNSHDFTVAVTGLDQPQLSSRALLRVSSGSLKFILPKDEVSRKLASLNNPLDLPASTLSEDRPPRKYYSEEKLELIRTAFRNSKGGIFGGIKPYLAYLLLSNSKFGIDFNRLLKIKCSYNEFFLVPGVKAALCGCEERTRMSDMLGWKSPKNTDAIDIFGAALKWGAAVAYCIPEKMIMIRFLTERKATVSHYAAKVELQDFLFHMLSELLVNRTPKISPGDVFVLKVSLGGQAEAQVQAPAYASFHEIFTRILVEGFGIDPAQPYTCTLPDGRTLVSPLLFAVSCCAHRLAADAVSMSSCNVHLFDEFLVLLGTDASVPFYMSIVSVETPHVSIPVNSNEFPEAILSL